MDIKYLFSTITEKQMLLFLVAVNKLALRNNPDICKSLVVARKLTCLGGRPLPILIS